MATEVYVPELGMTQAEITVIELTHPHGGPVEVDDVVMVIETAKVSYEVRAPGSGLVFYLKRVSDKVDIGDVLAIVADTEEEFKAYLKPVSHPASESSSEADPSKVAGHFFEDDEEETRGVRVSFDDEDSRPAHLPTPHSAPPPTLDLTGRRKEKSIPFIGMRRTVANNLVKSLHMGAQLTIVAETDLTELNRFREGLASTYPDTKITLVDLIVKILPAPLKEYPIVNSTISGDEIICWAEYNIGIGIAVDEGLVVPVLKDVDKKGLDWVSREIDALAKKARNGELRPEDQHGGTFTLASGATKAETDIITPIINPPESAILAMGKIAPRATVYRGELAVRTTAYLCLTHDHRNIDGVSASLFLGRLKEIIQTPELFRKILL